MFDKRTSNPAWSLLKVTGEVCEFLMSKRNFKNKVQRWSYLSRTWKPFASHYCQIYCNHSIVWRNEFWSIFHGRNKTTQLCSLCVWYWRRVWSPTAPPKRLSSVTVGPSRITWSPFFCALNFADNSCQNFLREVPFKYKCLFFFFKRTKFALFDKRRARVWG